MKNLGVLALAYALVWLAIAGYLYSIVRRQRALERRLEELKHHQEAKERAER